MIIEVFKNYDIELANKLYDHIDGYIKMTRSARKKQIKRIQNHEVGTRNSSIYLNHLGELRNLGLLSNRIVRVFDELILNPSDENEVDPSAIKKEIKEMRKEVKSILSDEDEKEESENKTDSDSDIQQENGRE